ncbi:MAG: DegV family protein [Chloroflexi bacterium]|nr:DegV family protein [Chloroflexota bacterium]
MPITPSPPTIVNRMQHVAIVTDSSSCLSPALAAEYGIEIVPYDLVFDGRVFRDGVDDVGDFYNLLKAAKKLPTTSAPSPGLFLEAFKRAAQRAESVLCITLPPELSSTHNSSKQAIMLAEGELAGRRILSVPAPAVASGQGLVAIEAARAAREGKSLDEVAALVPALAEQVHFYAVLDTLEYLAKGGHVPKAVGWLGDLVGLKPILTATYGKVERLSQVRSKRTAIGRMLGYMEEQNPQRSPIRALVMHAAAAQEAAAFRDEIAKRFQCDLLHVTQFTPVMGAHSGPGVVGVAFRVID